MDHLYIGVRSLTYAQKGAKALEREGIFAEPVRLPAELTAGGCAYALRLPKPLWQAAQNILRLAGVESGKLFSRQEGLWQELPR